jgi:hypothetical protein
MGRDLEEKSRRILHHGGTTILVLKVLHWRKKRSKV